jgi:putative endonuclease
VASNGRAGSTPAWGTLSDGSRFFMPYFVYILYSDNLRRFYTGTTDNVDERLNQHNSAKYRDSFSVKGIPWDLFFEIECETSRQAYHLEKFIKRMKSSRFIQRLKTEPQLIADLLERFK